MLKVFIDHQPVDGTDDVVTCGYPGVVILKNHNYDKPKVQWSEGITTNFACGRRREQTLPGYWRELPENTVTDKSDNRPFLLPGEYLPIFIEDQVSELQIKPGALAAFKSIVGSAIDWDLYREILEPVVALFDDYIPETNQGGKELNFYRTTGRNWGWCQDYNYQILGGGPPKGIWESLVLKDGNGPTNWSYDFIVYGIINLVWGNPADPVRLWTRILEAAFAKACLGVSRNRDQYDGYIKHPKGANELGIGGTLPPYTSKQHSAGLFWVNFLLGGHPFFNEVLSDHYDAMLHIPRNNAQTQGPGLSGGSRTVTYTLKSLNEGYGLWRGKDPRFLQSMEAHFDNCLDKADLEYGWRNTINGGVDPSSPWQKLKLCKFLEFVSRTYLGHSRYEEIIEVTKVCIRRGLDGVTGHSWYRDGSPRDPDYQTLPNDTGFADGMVYPAVRWLAQEDSAYWDAEAKLQQNLSAWAQGKTGMMDSDTADPKVISGALNALWLT